ncbi:uncharacterized protein PGTG_20413 [Puccinia graminis f. sp. tritici CRL 75-36-700-3]|uniref:Uncharacterized protein n=1 Tax=Puccinia graminis f. sp. tritici (strain CRL 75-36-700-3 / race SCCL) TaxID=418459 RepID=E3NY08_PUCGT|nr:uncharacterized protein PGTG_20413 [Puccinia graminis f. sp. tritici CRL 75-36-700-3]EFP94457.2 hypothetical protein PGTG_20413 [Puccinia graminis f. sp. tritici CRL 75-36-700-3]
MSSESISYCMYTAISIKKANASVDLDRAVCSIIRWQCLAATLRKRGYYEAEWPGSPADHNGIQRIYCLQSSSAPIIRRIMSVTKNIGLQIRLAPLCRLDSGSEIIGHCRGRHILIFSLWVIKPGGFPLHQWNSAVEMNLRHGRIAVMDKEQSQCLRPVPLTKSVPARAKPHKARL